MGAIKLVLVLFATELFYFHKVSGAVTDSNRKEYMYRFIPINAVNPKDFPNKKDTVGINKFKMVGKVQNGYQRSKSQKVVPLKIQNIHTVLEGFQTDHCLHLIDNWQGVDINQTSAIPFIIRKLEQAFSHRKIRWQDQEYLDQLLIPSQNSFMKGNFSQQNLTKAKYHNCPTSKLYYPLIADGINEAFCVDLDHGMFQLKSKLWQCEIQLNLLMPDHLLKNHNFPGFFRYNYCDQDFCDS